VLQVTPAASTEAGADDTITVDLRSFDQTYLELYAPMVRLAFLALGDRAQAEEVTQDAFVAVYRRWSSIDSPGAYVRQCVTNGCRDVLRRRRVLEALRLRRASTEAVEPQEHVEDLLASLPSRQRLVVVLRFYEDLTDTATAKILKCPPGTVRSLVSRGMETLRREVAR